MQLFNATIEGWETVEEEKKQFIKGVNVATRKALVYVSSELVAKLQQHIQTDVYNAYTPRVYKRRSDNPSLGLPLPDKAYFYTPIPNNGRLEFEYLPSGDHQNPDWVTRHGDELIRQLQNGYKYITEIEGEEVTKEVPARPFWDNFFEEQMNGGLTSAFINGMLMQQISVQKEHNDFKPDQPDPNL